LKTVAKGEKRKTLRGQNSGMQTKCVPASAQHRDIKKHTSSSQASEDGNHMQPPDTSLLIAMGVNQQQRQQRERKERKCYREREKEECI
jgi:hypothetical protein